MRVRQEDVACRYAISLSNLLLASQSSSLLIEAQVTHGCFGFHCQHRVGLSGSVAILGTGVPTVLGTISKLAS